MNLKLKTKNVNLIKAVCDSKMNADLFVQNMTVRKAISLSRKPLALVLLLAMLVQIAFPSSVIYAQTPASTAASQGEMTIEDLSNSEPFKPANLDEALNENHNQKEDIELIDIFVEESGISAEMQKKPLVRTLLKENFGVDEGILLRIDNGKGVGFEVKVYNSKGEYVDVGIQEEIIDRTKTFTLSAPKKIKPGKFTVEVKDTLGGSYEQDFMWGVLALNTNKSIYYPGENAEIAIAVLDERGMMVCDASVALKITDPAGNEEVLTTEGGAIKVNDVCHVKAFTLTPDFETVYQIGDAGVYKMVLAAETPNGIYTITDNFEVSEEIDFDIERVAATRIYPPARYPVEIKIKANEDFNGVITEIVPDNFDIYQSEGNFVHYDAIITEKEEDLRAESVLGASVDLAIPFKGDWQLTSNFGDKHDDHVLQKKYEEHGVTGHDGADFAMPIGTEIRVVDDGVVALAEEDSDYGTTVVIDHSWGRSYYGHLSKIIARAGTVVKKGETIALSGNTGLSTAPHLHFGIKPLLNDFNNGYYGKVNPLPYLGFESLNVLGVSTSRIVQVPSEVKVIQWEVSLEEGEEITLGYTYKAPEISPQFYTTGPLRFYNDQNSIEFSESRAWQIAVDPLPTPPTTTVIVLNSNAGGTCGSGCWTVPAGWNNSNNTIEVIGPGGNGATSTTVPGGGGGGGGYAKAVNQTLSGNINFNIGTGGSGTATWFSTSGTLAGAAGGNASGRTGGSGGAGSGSAATDTGTGGTGGTGANTAGAGGGGGAGAGGPTGNGGNGGASSGAASAGGGGGGNGGGSAGASSTNSTATNGGNGYLGTGAGTSGGNATANTGGGGGGGAGTTAAGGAAAGGDGAEGLDLIGGTEGSGGGSGGGGGNTRTAGNGNDGGAAGAVVANTGAGGGGGGDCTDAGCTEGAGATGSAGKIVITYTGNVEFPEITQAGYIFENDDSTSGVDENTQQAAGATAITNVKKGERLTLRTHLENSGTGALGSELALFYDRNDGIWSKVSNATPSAITTSGTCSNSDWNCETVISANAVGEYTSIAVDSSGRPWVAYYENATTSCDDSPTSECSLNVAYFVGAGGTGCLSSAWSCTIVDNPSTTGNLGQYASIAINPATGYPWISYYDVTNTQLKVAQYSPGTAASGTCSANWLCEAVDNTGTNTGQYTSIAFDASSNPWVSFYDVTSTALRVATRGGGFGSACTDADWTCGVVDNTGTKGQYSSIAFSPDGIPWVSYWDVTDTQLVVASMQAGSGCTDSGWTCENVDNSDNTGPYTSIAIDPSGNPWVSYYSNTQSALIVATRGGGFGSACTDADWTCGGVDDGTNVVGLHTSIAFAPDGNPWISYFNASSEFALKITRFVGSGGSGCGASGSAAWTCNIVDDTGSSTGQYTSFAFAADGTPWVSYYDSTNTALKVAKVHRSGEIRPAAGLAGANGATISESHADMTAVDDTTERDDTGTALCVGGTSVNWNNGKWFESEEASGLSSSLPAGNTTVQCTEVAWVIDTSQTIPGETYRFVVASKDAWNDGKGLWRGPIAIDEYPTLTIQSGTPSIVYSKDAQARFANCTATNWGCQVVDSSSTSLATFWTSIDFDSRNAAWISYYDATNQDLKVANYVGGTGGNCSGTAWNCVAVDTSVANVGSNTSLVIDNKDRVWVSYRDATNGYLKVAVNYDHPLMSACSASGWDCINVDTAANVGFESSIALDPAGNPWISYWDSTNSNLKVARFVGGTGGNCSATSWSCMTVDSAASSTGEYSSIEIGPDGKVWIAYCHSSGSGCSATTRTLKVAHYVGSGGNCSHTAWSCTTVDSSADVGQYISLTINPADNNPWLVYYSTGGGGTMKYANYVGGTGGNCTSTAWDCGNIHTSIAVGPDPSIKFAPDGTAWVGFFDDTSGSDRGLFLAQYVGSGGDCANAVWECTAIDTIAANTGEYMGDKGMRFDKSGVPWMAYRDNTNGDLKVAKLHLPSYKNNLLYLLDRGDSSSPISEACDSTANYEGYCGHISDNGEYDSMTSLSTEYPIYLYATKNSNNTDDLAATWVGKSTVAATVQAFNLEVYNFSTNAWVSADTESGSACTASDCTLTATLDTNQTNYYEQVGSDYYTYWRVYQGAAAETLSADSFGIVFGSGGPEMPTLSQLMRHGAWFNSSGVRQPFSF